MHDSGEPSRELPLKGGVKSKWRITRSPGYAGGFYKLGYDTRRIFETKDPEIAQRFLSWGFSVEQLEEDGSEVRVEGGDTSFR
jgi:hypothetical protein